VENLHGKQLGPYHILAPLGEGGMASVYKSYQPSLERYVALKVLPRRYTSDPQFVARFRQEARLIASLEHLNILPVYDFGEADGYPYIVMRYVEGKTLADLLQGKPLPIEQIRKVMRQVGDALDYAHERGVIHRDIKPRNILIDGQGNCLLSDFGLARMVEASTHLTVTGTVMGTPAYMSPEQGLGEDLDPRTDVYSLGVVLYEMTVGRVPYQADTPMAIIMKHIHEPLPPPRHLNPELPKDVERVILKALAKRREDRFTSAGEMNRSLQEAVRAQGLETRGPTAKAPRPRVRFRARLPASPALPAVEAPASATPGVPSTLVARATAIRSLPKWGWALGALAAVGVMVVIFGGRLLVLGDQAEPAGERSASEPTAVAGISAASATLERPTEAEVNSIEIAATASPAKIATSTPTAPPRAIAASSAAEITVLRTFQIPNPVALITSPDASLIAALLDDTMTLAVWDVELGSSVWEAKEHTARISSINWSPDGSLLATASDDGTARVWDASDGSVLSVLQGHAEGVKDVVFSPNGELLATVSDGGIRTWRASDGVLMGVLLDRASRSLHYPIGWPGGYYWPTGSHMFAFTPDSSRLIAPDGDTIREWDVASGDVIMTMRQRTGPVNYVSISPDGQLVAVGSAALWGVRVWTVQGGSLEYLLGEEYGLAYDVDFSSDGSLLVSAGRIWSVSDGSLLHSLNEGSLFINGTSFSPDGSLVAMLTVDPQRQGVLGLWNAEEGTMVRQLETMDCGGPNYCNYTFFAAFSPDRTALLTADDTGKIKVWGFPD